MKKFRPEINFQEVYKRFNESVTPVDCGQMCAPYNPSGKPFCCDICQAVPAAYRQEWAFLRKNTDLWRLYRGDACGSDPSSLETMRSETPSSMLLLECKGPSLCQRNFRAVSCRQFPFFPFITADYRFIGLAYEWTFEPTCWVISNLGMVTPAFRQQFVDVFDDIFNLWPDEMDSYAALSEQMRAYFLATRRRIPILHRNGGYYLLSPGSERLTRASAGRFRRFGPYRGMNKLV
jgi:hypothetical protein